MNTQDAPFMHWGNSSHSTNTGGECVGVALASARWLKGSHSTGTGGRCVEVAATMSMAAAEWRKGSRSTGTGGACVEVADLAAAVAVRDSKDPDGPKLVFGPDAWRAFATQVKTGTLDLA